MVSCFVPNGDGIFDVCNIILLNGLKCMEMNKHGKSFSLILLIILLFGYKRKVTGNHSKNRS